MGYQWKWIPLIPLLGVYGYMDQLFVPEYRNREPGFWSVKAFRQIVHRSVKWNTVYCHIKILMIQDGRCTHRKNKIYNK